MFRDIASNFFQLADVPNTVGRLLGEIGSSEGATMKVFMKTHKVISSAQASAALNKLAREHGIAGHNYDPAIAHQLSEFDAMKWTTLCAQRSILLERETIEPAREWPVPHRLVCFYEVTEHVEPVMLENAESLSEIAA